MKRYLGTGLLLLIGVLLVGCGQDYNSKSAYFNGAVLVEYQQLSARDSSDSITMTFYEPGSYHVAFSQTPGKNSRDCCGANVMPKDFDATFDQAPRVRVITQYIIPDFLRVTITHKGVTEAHDFQ